MSKCIAKVITACIFYCKHHVLNVKYIVMYTARDTHSSKTLVVYISNNSKNICCFNCCCVAMCICVIVLLELIVLL